MTHVILTGDSHLSALKHAFDKAPSGQYPDVTFWPLGRGKLAVTDFFHHDAAARKVTITADQWEKPIFSAENVAKLGEEVLIVVSLPVNSSRVLRDYQWITHVPWRLKQCSSEVAVTDAVVEAIFDQDSRKGIAFVTALLAIGLDVVVLEGPRFFANSPHLSKTRPDVSAQIEHHYRTYVRDQLAQRGISSIPQPSETLAPDGCTLPAFDHENPNDAHHANAAFGLLMLTEIRHYLAARYGTAS